MKIKKTLALTLAGSLACLAISCGDAPNYKMYLPDGAPAIAASKLMSEGLDDMDFTVVSPTAVAKRVSSGDADFAIMPVNAAATLYNGGAQIIMLSVNTHGNLYVVGAEGDITLDGLKGKRVGVIGMGNVPDLTLKMLLEKSEIGYEQSDTAIEGKVAVSYAADGGALMPMLKKGDIDYGVLAEPAASTAVKNLNKSIVCDVQAEWEKLFGGDYPQACLVARKEIVEKKSEYVQSVIDAFIAADGWAEQNPESAVNAVKANMESGTESTLATLTSEIIARCNIKTVKAADCKAACASYFEALTKIKTGVDSSTTALSKVPDDGFYF